MKSTVTILIVARNEEENILNIIRDIENQSYPLELIELIFVDSMSTDSTKTIMEKYIESSKFKKVRVFSNPKKILAPGWNIGLQNYKTDYIIRIDAHSSITNNFIEENVKLLDSGENVTGGPRPNIVNPNNNSKIAPYILAAEKALFGSSFAYYRNGTSKRYVNSIFHGMFKKEVIDKVGLFNERLGRTEDNDYYYRVREAGFKILFSPDIVSFQYTRDSLESVLKQKFDNGYWIGKTTFISPKCLSLFYFIPLVLVLTTILSVLLMTVSLLPFFVLLTIYCSFVIINSVLTTIQEKLPILKGIFMLSFLFIGMHYAYGIGILKGLFS